MHITQKNVNVFKAILDLKSISFMYLPSSTIQSSSCLSRTISEYSSSLTMSYTFFISSSSWYEKKKLLKEIKLTNECEGDGLFIYRQNLPCQNLTHSHQPTISLEGKGTSLINNHNFLTQRFSEWLFHAYLILYPLCISICYDMLKILTFFEVQYVQITLCTLDVTDKDKAHNMKRVLV